MAKCSNCGFNFSDSFQYCPKCGEVKDEFSPDLANSGPHCPYCGDGEFTRLLSDEGVYKAQSSLTETPSPFTQIMHTFSLQKNFSEPDESQHDWHFPPAPLQPEPHQFSADPMWSWLSSITAIIGGSLILSEFTGFMSLFDHSVSAFLGFLVWLVMALLVGGMVAYFTAKLANKINHTSEKFTRANESYTLQMQEYSKAKAVWEKLYYCSKHEVVFLDNSAEPIPLKQAVIFCFKKAAETN